MGLARAEKSIRRAALLCCGGIAGVGIFLPIPAGAWGNACTHPRITANAITLINNPSGSAPTNFYVEFSGYQPQMQTGSTDEDNPLANVANHFYDPTTGLDFHDSDQSDKNLIQQALVDSPVVSSLVGTGTAEQTAIIRGRLLFDQAVASYQQGTDSKKNIYIKLGHALHLLTQDMTQPAHVHNDPHVPPTWFSIFVPKGVDGSNVSPLEQSAENSCRVRFSDQTRHLLGALPATLSEHYPPASRTITRHPFGGDPATAG